MTGTPSARNQLPPRAASAIAGETSVLPTTPAGAPAGAVGELSLATLQSRWGELVRQLLQGGLPLVAAAIGDSTPVTLSTDSLTITAPPARLSVLTDPEQQRMVANACLAVFGRRLRLVVRAGGATVGGQPAVTDERQRRYQAAQEHPVVKEILQRFGADLIGRELVDVQTWLARLAAEREQTPRRRFQGDLQHGDFQPGQQRGATETLGDG